MRALSETLRDIVRRPLDLYLPWLAWLTGHLSADTVRAAKSFRFSLWNSLKWTGGSKAGTILRVSDQTLCHRVEVGGMVRHLYQKQNKGDRCSGERPRVGEALSALSDD